MQIIKRQFHKTYKSFSQRLFKIFTAMCWTKGKENMLEYNNKLCLITFKYFPLVTIYFSRIFLHFFFIKPSSKALFDPLSFRRPLKVFLNLGSEKSLLE